MSFIITPFNNMDAEIFASEMKPKISGVDLTLEYENIESSVCKVAEDLIEILTEELYEAICLNKASQDKKLQAKALDYLQRSMLHFCMNEHLIFLVARIKDDGVTVVKNENETTAYKYVQDGLENKFISLGWFWMNKLLQLLEKNAEQFPLWKDCDTRNDLADIPIDRTDFAKWVGVRDEYFVVVVRWLIREAWSDCVTSRIKDPVKTDAIARAMCYEVMGRACSRLAFLQLPEPVRLDISNEVTKANKDKEESNVRKRVASSFTNQAAAYWTALEVQLKNDELKNNPQARPVYAPPRISENDSFVY
ncbi:MAG: DUF6712 family protein [Dysgonomonas sp.]|nr:DUF6712 family protein [Dysgonomonas sp.]